MNLLKNIGIGVDIVEIKRFKKIPYASHKNFYRKIFSSSEINYCLKFKEPYKHFAGKFAIKEAVKKAISDDIALANIQTRHENSKPIVSIKGETHSFLVSVSHEHDIAVAVVISEKN
jgi:holo-[acyl-carrier-protein] synthase